MGKDEGVAMGNSRIGRRSQRGHGSLRSIHWKKNCSGSRAGRAELELFEPSLEPLFQAISRDKLSLARLEFSRACSSRASSRLGSIPALP